MEAKPLAFGLSSWDFMYKLTYPTSEERGDLFLFHGGRNASLLERANSSRLPRVIRINRGLVNSFRDIAFSIEINKYPRVFFPARKTEDGSVVFYEDDEDTPEELGRQIVAEIGKLCIQ